MEFKQIQELIKQINKSRVTELHYEQEGFKITIKKEERKKAEQNTSASVPSVSVVNPPVSYPTQQVAPNPAAPQPAPTPAAQPAPKEEKTTPKNEEKGKENLLTIKSPMIGTFYRSSSPDKPVFVNVGDKVSAGDNVCIIEAMKLFNEVESEVNGKIVEVLVEDASPVEFDQPLFLVKP